MFFFAKMRQPSLNLYRVLDVNTFSDFLDELLSDRNFLMESDDDENLVVPPLNQCLNNEFNIREDAVRLCMEEGFSIKDALWHTLADKEHRMQHWIPKLSIANSRQDSSKVQKLEQRLAALEKQRRRSRSPRRQQSALPAPQQPLALPSSDHRRGGKSLAKGSGKGNNQNQASGGTGRNQVTGQGFRTFRTMFTHRNAKEHFHQDTCWKYQSGVCKDSYCLRKHACVGCGKANVPNDSCGCLESKLSKA